MRNFLCLLIVLCGGLLWAQEDILLLKDGRIFDGITLERVEDGVLVHYKHGDIHVPEALIEEALIVGQEAPDYVPKNAEESKKLEEGLVPFEGKWVSPKVRERKIQKRIAERRAMVDEIDQHSVWRNRYKVKTKYFNFEHTIPPYVFDRYSNLMEAYFASFCKEWKVKPQKGYGVDPKDSRLLVCFYNDEDLFHQVSGAGRGTLGYFRFVKPLELNIYYERLDPSLTEEVMFHEANHYLQKLINVKFSYPHWPGEALAEYYGASRWDEKKKKISSGHVLEGRLTEVLTDIDRGKWLHIEELLATSRYEHYTWGWTLVHFFMNDKRYAKKFHKFYVALANDKKIKRQSMGVDGLKTVRQEDVLPVLKEYLGIKTQEELETLEKEWFQYIQEELQVTSSHGLEKAAENARRYGRPIRAKRLFEEAFAAGGASALAHHNYAKLLVRNLHAGKGEDDDWDLAQEHWQQAIQISPMTGEFYFSLGEAMMDFGDREEGARLMQLAGDLDPHNHRMLMSIEELTKEDS